MFQGLEMHWQLLTTCIGDDNLLSSDCSSRLSLTLHKKETIIIVFIVFHKKKLACTNGRYVSLGTGSLVKIWCPGNTRIKLCYVASSSHLSTTETDVIETGIRQNNRYT